MQVAGQNIANAQTPGYSRQTLALQASTPENTPFGTFGTGVTDRQASRAIATRCSTSSIARSQRRRLRYQQRSTLLGQIQNVFGEPSDTGLANTMDNFFNSWSELASNPADASAKAVVQQSGAQLASTFNSYATQLSNIAANNRTGISAIRSRRSTR